MTNTTGSCDDCLGALCSALDRWRIMRQSPRSGAHSPRADGHLLLRRHGVWRPALRHQPHPWAADAGACRGRDSGALPLGQTPRTCARPFGYTDALWLPGRLLTYTAPTCRPRGSYEGTPCWWWMI